MTGRTAGQLSGGPDVPLLSELLADFFLIRRRFPIHVVNLVERPQNLLRIAVAIDAPFHQQRIGLENQRHLIDGTVAGRASHALVHVDAVIEVREIGKPVHFYPADRSVGSIALANRFEVPCVVKENRVAIHAGFCRRNSSRLGSFHGRVAVAAVDAIVPHVMFVAELYRLLTGNVLPRLIRRPRQSQNSQQRDSCQEDGGEQTETRDEIRTAVKNLGHVLRCAVAEALHKGSRLGGTTVFHREARARVVIDAIVSNKTFGKATLMEKFLRSGLRVRETNLIAESREQFQHVRSFKSILLSQKKKVAPFINSFAARKPFSLKHFSLARGIRCE